LSKAEQPTLRLAGEQQADALAQHAHILIIGGSGDREVEVLRAQPDELAQALPWMDLTQRAKSAFCMSARPLR
jgi:hypothetical protein